MTPKEKNDLLFWKKKEFISFILSILIFFIHTFFAPNSGNGNLISIINHKTSYFFSQSITHYAVPMFFILSGITFFKGYSHKKYLSKIKYRIFSLIIPYLLWNTVWLLWEIFCSYSFLSKISTSSPYPLTIQSILKGILFYNCNMPFWFVFDLIIFVIASPIVFTIIRNKYIGIIAIACLSILALFNIHLPISIFYYPTSIIFYLIGATIGYHYFYSTYQCSSKTTQIISVSFLTTYVLLKNIVPEELQINNYLIQVIVFTLCAFALWNIVDIFIETIKPQAIYRRSFAIYAMHLNVSGIVFKILSLCIPQREWLKIPEFVIIIITTLLIINLFCSFLEKFFPQIYSLLMGKPKTGRIT